MLKVTSVTVVTIILISNVYPINNWVDTFLDENHYAYSNGDGTVTHIYNAFKDGEFNVPHDLSTARLDPRQPRMDTTGGLVELPAGTLLRRSYPDADTTMYRLFRKNPLTFWRWKYYIIGNEKYDYPYRNWHDILSKRPFKKPENSTFQEF